jgi:hypothetical protein
MASEHAFSAREVVLEVAREDARQTLPQRQPEVSQERVVDVQVHWKGASGRYPATAARASVTTTDEKVVTFIRTLVADPMFTAEPAARGLGGCQ